jgi:hypothetical protein
VQTIRGADSQDGSLRRHAGSSQHHQLGAMFSRPHPRGRMLRRRSDTSVKKSTVVITVRSSNWWHPSRAQAGSIPGNVAKAAVMQLVGDGHRRGRPVTVLGQDQVRLTGPWVVPLPRIRPVD